MSKTKEYRVKLTVEKNTGGATDAAKELRGFMSTLMLVNIPFRVYGLLLRDNHRVQQLLAATTGEASTAMTAQGGAATGESAALATVNAQLAEMLLLQAALSEGAAVPGMTAGLTAGASIVAAAAAGGAAAALPLQEGGIVTRTGTALVHAGETILPAGGMGGDVSITNHVTVAPGGIDLTDFTNAMNEQMRLALRGHTRNLPV